MPDPSSPRAPVLQYASNHAGGRGFSWRLAALALVTLLLFMANFDYSEHYPHPGGMSHLFLQWKQWRGWVACASAGALLFTCYPGKPRIMPLLTVAGTLGLVICWFLETGSLHADEPVFLLFEILFLFFAALAILFSVTLLVRHRLRMRRMRPR